MEAATQHSSEVAEQAARLRLAITRTARRLRQSAGSELGPSTAAALASIDRRGPLTPSGLAEAEGIRRPTATRIIARLEEKGLAERTADPTDRRCSLISVTREGRALLRRLRSRKTAYLARHIAALPAEEAATLERAAGILERMLEQERS
jgi:DNA-binding MarR family transcriptional regulator